MRVLLDECVDRRLLKHLAAHDATTVAKQGWSGITNGRLLALAEKDFDVLITMDRNLSFQQSLPRFQIALLVLRARSNRLADLLPLVPELVSTISSSQPGTAVVVPSGGL
jgi:hypothetical protein